MRINHFILYINLIMIVSVCLLGCDNKEYSNGVIEQAENVLEQKDTTNANEDLIEQMDDIDNSIDNEADNETYISMVGNESVESVESRVICYGDSLTEGYGGDGITWPDTLAELSGVEVINYGVFGEPSSCIASRQGSNSQVLVDDIIIPADCTPVAAQVSGKYGWEILLVFGDAGVNNCSIDGIEGVYSIDDDGQRLFTRLTPGEETVVKAGTPLITYAMQDKQPDDIMVIWAGSNDTLDTKEDIQLLIQKLNEMVDYHGNDKYVIVSLTSRHSRINIVDDVNDSLSREFGEHYLDLRHFMVYEALDELQIEPTEHDKDAISKGDVPFSIRYSEDEEENHGNSDFYYLAGKQIYLKLVELGYLEAKMK